MKPSMARDSFFYIAEKSIGSMRLSFGEGQVEKVEALLIGPNRTQIEEIPETGSSLIQ